MEFSNCIRFIVLLYLANSAFSQNLYEADVESFITASKVVLELPTVAHCNALVIAFDSNFTDHVFEPFINLVMEQGIVYQIWRFDVVQNMKNIPWRLSSCDIYIFIIQDLLHLLPLLTKTDFEWDWEGRYLFLTRSSLAEINEVGQTYKMKKVKRGLFISDDAFKSKEKEGVQLYSHVLYSDPSAKLVTSFAPGKRGIVNDDLFPSEIKFNFGGKSVVISTFPFEPSVMGTVDSKGIIQNATGVDIKFVEATAKAMNFIPIYRTPEIHRWGFYENGTYTNLFYDASFGEAEMGICNIFLSHDRASIMTFSYPYDYDNTKFIGPQPGIKPPFLAVTFPFSIDVWLVMLGCIIVLIVFIPFFAAYLPEKDKSIYHSPGGSVLVTIAAFTNRTISLPKNGPFKVLFGGILLSGFITTLYYSSNLVAFMTVTATEEPIKTIKQITENDNIQVGSMGTWILEFPGTDHLVQKYYEIGVVMDGVPDILDGKAVIVQNRQHLEFLVRNYLTKKGKRLVRLVEENANYFPIAAILQRHSPLAGALKMITLRLQGGGLLSKFFSESLRDARAMDLGHDYGFIKETAEEKPEGVQPLTMEHVQGIFLAYGIGCTLSVLILMIELGIQTLKHKGRMQISKT